MEQRLYRSWLDVVLLGQADATKINIDELGKRLDGDDHQSVAQSLREMEFKSEVELLATYAGQGPDLRTWPKGAEINRDRNLLLQYLAGMGLNSYQSWSLHEELLAYYRFPSRRDKCLYYSSSGLTRPSFIASVMIFCWIWEGTSS